HPLREQELGPERAQLRVEAGVVRLDEGVDAGLDVGAHEALEAIDALVLAVAAQLLEGRVEGGQVAPEPSHRVLLLREGLARELTLDRLASREAREEGARVAPVARAARSEQERRGEQRGELRAPRGGRAACGAPRRHATRPV